MLEQISLPTSPIKKSKIKLVIILTGIILLALVAFVFYYYNSRQNISLETKVESNFIELTSDRTGQIIDLAVGVGEELKTSDFIARFDTTNEIASLALAKQALQDIYAGRDVNYMINDVLKNNQLELEARSLIAKAEEEKANRLMQEWSLEHSRLLVEFRKNANNNPELQKKVLEAENNLKQANTNYEMKALERARIDSEINKMRGSSASKEQLLAYLNTQILTLEHKLASQNILAPFDCFVQEIFVRDMQVISAGMPIIKLVPKHKGSVWLNARFNKNAHIVSSGKCTIIDTYNDEEILGTIGEVISRHDNDILVKIYFDDLENFNFAGKYEVKLNSKI